MPQVFPKWISKYKYYRKLNSPKFQSYIYPFLKGSELKKFYFLSWRNVNKSTTVIIKNELSFQNKTFTQKTSQESWFVTVDKTLNVPFLLWSGRDKTEAERVQKHEVKFFILKAVGKCMRKYKKNKNNKHKVRVSLKSSFWSPIWDSEVTDFWLYDWNF